MIYNYRKGTDDGFVVTGVDETVLYGLHGFTEAQAMETAFHLNAALDRGRREVQAELRETLGLKS